MKLSLNLLFFGVLFGFFSHSVYADEILQIKEDKALASMTENNYKVGDLIEIKGPDKEIMGKAKVLQVSAKLHRYKEFINPQYQEIKIGIFYLLVSNY